MIFLNGTYMMDEIISYKMCAVKVRNAKLRNYLNWLKLRIQKVEAARTWWSVDLGIAE